MNNLIFSLFSAKRTKIAFSVTITEFLKNLAILDKLITFSMHPHITHFAKNPVSKIFFFQVSSLFAHSTKLFFFLNFRTL